MNKYRLGRIRSYAWLCIILGALSVLNYVLFYPFPGRARVVGPQDPLWEFVRPLMMTVNLLHAALVPILLGYVLLEVARVHEHLDRLAGDLEAVRYRDEP